MVAERLEVIILADDKASGVFGKFGSNLQKVGKIALGVAAGGIAAIAAGVTALASQAIPAASNLNEALNATSVVFGDAAGDVQAFGKIAADVAGLSAAEFNQMAAQSGAMLQNFGLSASDAADNTITLAQRAADMASIFNTDVSEAFTAINAALRGEADPIERFGVSMNALAVDAKALELGFKKVNGQFTTEAKTQARLALLYEQTDKIAGDFVNTSDQLANATRVQQKRWENFMAELGQGALPIIGKFQGILLDIGERVMPILVDAATRFFDWLGPIADAIGKFIENVSTGTDPVLAFAGFLSEIAGRDIAMQFLDIVDSIQLFIAKIQEAVQPVIDWVQENIGLKDVLIGLGVAIAAVLLPILASIVAAVLPIIAIFAVVTLAVAIVRKAWEENWGGMQEKVAAVVAWFQGTLMPFIIDTLWPWLKDKLTQALTTLGNFWRDVLWPAIQAVWNWLSTVLIPFFQNTLWPWLQETIPAAIQTLSDFWTNTLKPAIEAVWSFIQDNLIPLFQDLWDLLQVAGETAIIALQLAWENVLLPALTAIWEFIDKNLMPIFTDLWQFINDTIVPFLDGVFKKSLEGITKAFDGIRQAVRWLIDKIEEFKSKLESIKDKLPPWLQSNSPTPFELGLRGIADAMDQLNRVQLPAFTAQLSATGAVPTAASAGGITQNYNLTINEAGRRGNLLGDYRLLQAWAR